MAAATSLRRYARFVRPVLTPTGRAGVLRALPHLPNIARLYWRLFRDVRVGLFPKAILVAGVVYVVSPIDLVPDWLLVLGQLDDLAIIFLAARAFLRACPADVVAEHVDRLAGRRA
jgi:uncharacterized membrane protein YkvA (DUF1232 family)